MAIICSTKIDGSMFPQMRDMLRDREIIIRISSKDDAKVFMEANLHPQFKREMHNAISATWPEEEEEEE